MADLSPAYTTPKELAMHLGVSERALRERARALGACRELGNRMILLPEDVRLILEDMRPCPSSTNGSPVGRGTSTSPAPTGDFAALQAHRTRTAPSGSPRMRQPQNGDVISMDWRRV